VPLGFFSPYKEVRCTDGNPRYILKDPAKAFAIQAPDWQARIGALAKFFNQVTARVSVDVAHEYRSLVDDLDNNYADIRTHYLAAYAQFCTNPCDKVESEKLDKANEEIRQREFKLRELEVKVEQLSKMARDTRGAALSSTPSLPDRAESDIEVNFPGISEFVNAPEGPVHRRRVLAPPRSTGRPVLVTLDPAQELRQQIRGLVSDLGVAGDTRHLRNEKGE
jgi:hypothetical protein